MIFDITYLQMEGGGQYPGYMPTCTQSWNNNIPGGPGHVQNSYSLAGHGQPSPLPPGGPQGGQAPVPSPLYPWMRSQFGKKLFYFHFVSELQFHSIPSLCADSVDSGWQSSSQEWDSSSDLEFGFDVGRI